jgi:hypothetical protein
MKDIRSYLTNYITASSGYSFGQLKDNPGDDTGSALTADLFNDLLYGFYAFINKYGTVSDTDESESASDFVNTLEAFAVYKTGDQVMGGNLTVRSAGTAARIWLQTTGSGSSDTDGFGIGISDDTGGIVVLSVYEAYKMLFLTSAAERLRLAADSPRISVANNARDLVDSSGYVVADKIRATGLIDGVTWTSAQLVGSGLSISSIGAPALCALNGTDVAFVDSTIDELRTYRWNGSTWSLVGSGLSISGAGIPTLCALNSTDVAFVDEAIEELRTYRWNGSTWSLVGSGLSISGIGASTLCALNSTDVAFIDATLEELRTYRWNGSTWSLVGSGLSISSIGLPTLCALNGTDVAFIDTAIEELQTYRFGFSLMGNPPGRGDLIS